MLIKLTNIHKSYGTLTIFDSAEVTFTEGQKIGVIGRNGAGKSTLCRIITGEESADAGEVWMASELRLAYLPQHDPYTLEETLLEFLVRYTTRPDWQCAKVAAQFQLGGELLAMKVGEVSGGYRTRLKLAAMLVEEPNFLILDEPSNYLDLHTLILLEKFLQDYNGGFLVVSHDREFLRRTCEETLEVENGEMSLYPGDVEEYLVFKSEQVEQAMAYNRNIEAKQKQLQHFVDRFRAKASKASQARSKMKQLNRLKTIAIDHPMKNVRIRIPAVPRRHGVAFRCEEMAIGYPEKTVARDITMDVPQGARVAVLGDNGQGKTTFLRTIAGDLPPLTGSFRWGHMLKTGYYAQHVYATLDQTITVKTYLGRKAAHDVLDQEILDLAGSFLFRGEDVEKRIGVLSGGERARLVLAGILLAKCPVILLDEPTNHLDFETVEALGEALSKFVGTLFFVSHDRTFVNMVATEIIEVGDSKVIRYPGSYEDYVYSMEKRADADLGRSTDATNGSDGDEETSPAGKTEFLERKEQNAQRRKLEARLKKSEEKIEYLREQRRLLEEKFAAQVASATPESLAKFAQIESQAAKEEENWISIQAGLEGFQSLNPNS